MKNTQESGRVARHPSVRATPKNCYLNALRVVQHIPGYEQAWYVEGLAVLPIGFAVEHGWVERGGDVVDPTPPPHDEGVVYFPGLRFRCCQGIAEALNTPKPRWTKDFPLFYRHGWGGHDSPDFRAAREAAWAF